MNSETIADLLIVLLVLSLLITIIAVISKGFKSRGGGSITTMAGATHDMLNDDRKRALGILVEQKAKKKMEEQETGEPKDK